MNSLIASLPTHQYCYAWTDAIAYPADAYEVLTPCVWFGLVSFPGRIWGCNVMLPSGAIYRNVPLNALVHDPVNAPGRPWTPSEAALWDCYGYDFSLHAYTYLEGLRAKAKVLTADGVEEYFGDYLFTAAPMGDGYSAAPEQAKEFKFLKLENGHYCALPTDRVLFMDASLPTTGEWPKNLKRQTEVTSAEKPSWTT